MTGPARRIPARRASDKGRWGQIRAWWDEWGQLIMGAWLGTISVVVVVIALLVWQQQAASNRRDAATAKAAKVSCQRSRTLGPQLADYYARDPAFPQDVLALYRRTIPRACPK